MLTKNETKLLDFENTNLYINGQFTKANSGEVFTVYNPSTNEKVADVPKAGQEETQVAIEAANQAFPAWAKLTAGERADYLIKLKDLLIKNQEELATIMTKEMGKVYQESLGEVVYAAKFLEWYAEEGKRVYGRTIPASAQDKRLFVTKQPVGVVAAITPWNFPIAMLTRKLGPAIASGCTIVIKPASQASLTALAFATLVEQAQIPNGVINIVTGKTEEISDELFSNKIIKKISFTGSTRVGKKLVTKSADQLKKLSLELGGHAPFIVLDDANIADAAEGAVNSKFRNAGQTCVCANRIYVHEDVKEQFLEEFKKKVESLIVGDSLKNSVDIGPLVNESGLAKVEEHVQDAISKGGNVVCGGQRAGDENGYFYTPTILDNVNDEMKIMFEETFGPVAPIASFSNIDDVIISANDTEYGLAAYIYTNDINKAIQLSESLDFGVIGLNDAMPGVPQAPFGGMKESGFGREGGQEGIEDYLETKFVSLKLS
ncbi:NAD-dependent succinate-semialdehyde dehydrogenase [Anaerobacillus sp. MEB173]|uniref:NAD-dependent succinate-semialdehyde dehydrogenase n=1 Tax=Anaerobacillus sp. MEB173 TaxID=3383345 RepID=UPI003F8E090B